LCYRCSTWQDTLKVRVRPNRRKQNADIGESVGIDKAREQAEGKIGSVDRMCRKKGIACLKLDGPKTVEFDDGCLSVVEWGGFDLRWHVKAHR
jgi:hypothetical protein